MLVDTFGRTVDYLRLSVTDRCDLRCSYCIPRGFKDFKEPSGWLTFDEIERVVAAFAKLGTKHFRLTGGEPLLRKQLPELINRLSFLSGVEDLSLTTNATQLSRFAAPLKEAGLNRLNVSLDSLDKECVKYITGQDSLSKVLSGLMAAKTAGFEKIKINMVPLAGVNHDEIEHMIAFCIENDFILRLIELMPMGISGQQFGHINLSNIIEQFQFKYRLHETENVFGSGPARYWQTDSGHFSLGLITPMSQHFCATCNRVRLSVDGTLYMCLGQEHSFPLRDILRSGCSDTELENAIKEAIHLKPEAHDFLNQPRKITRIMAATGG